MRIISGQLKGKSINFVKNTATRPLKDSVKENIFNILKHSNLINVQIEKANILDLYSGIGSFGLECISRGAKHAAFFEKDLNTLKILNENIVKLSVMKQATVNNGKIENFLSKKQKKNYNIFFLNRPFSDLEFIENLNSIKKNVIFPNKHVVIIHREKFSKDNLDNILSILIEKTYGRSKIIFGKFK